MKDKFSAFYEKPNLEELWENCHFIFDTNIFINLYKKYPKKTYEKFIDILENNIGDRIWMPYQVGWEYQKNRIKHVKDEEKKLKTTIDKVNGFENDIKQVALNPLNKIKKETFFIDLNNYLDCDSINQRFKKIFEILDDINEDINRIQGNINFLDDDEIRDQLDILFENRVGDNYPPERLKEIEVEGEYRYSNKIPPGFEDKNKKSGNIYGDLIIWYQIIDYANNNKKPIIFITDDSKKDWWLIHGKEIICPHPFLIQEFSLTGQEILIYTFHDFLSKSKEYLNVQVETEVIEAVRIIDELQELKDEVEEIGTIELSGSAQWGSALQQAVQVAKRQQELIKTASSTTALETAVKEAKRQQELIKTIGSTTALETAVKEANRRQELIKTIGSTTALETAVKEAKRRIEIIKSMGYYP